MTHVSNSPADTERVAADLAATLRGGDVVALVGDLGAGKTNFARGLVAGLGGRPSAVSSPTYVLLHVYDAPSAGPIRTAVFHLDAYRVGGPSGETAADDLEAVGFSELLDQGGVVVVEWADRVADLLPATTVTVRLTATGRASRRIEIDDRRGSAG